MEKKQSYYLSDVATHWVMDIETLSNCFVAIFIDYKTDNEHVFVIHESQNDILKLVEFLERNIELSEKHISFNGLAFDSQIIQYIIDNSFELSSLSGEQIARNLYLKAQDVIDRSNRGEFAEYAPFMLSIPQLDLYKLNHWDNAAKRSSLKWIQFSMDWYNVMDMPIKHTDSITKDQIAEIIIYCRNDVSSTKEIMFKSKKLIELRKTLSEEYDMDLLSASEPKIAKEIFLHFLSEQWGVAKKAIRYLRTHRKLIHAKDILLPYIEFKTATFQKLHSVFKDVVIDPEITKGGFKYSIKYKGVKTDFGLGGVHGAKECGVYTSTEEMVILSSDVESFYPNLAIKNEWAPLHLPKDIFCNLYGWFFSERKKIPKKDPKNYVYKIILNSTYGLSNDKNSFLYDPELTMKITLNGQLSLMMLYEMITTRIPEAIPLMQNTDGLETMIPRSAIEEYYKICEEWQELTKLKLEHGTYQKLILGDVNNYIAVNEFEEVSKDNFDLLKIEEPQNLFKEENGKYYYAATKCKGRFEFKDLALHKNKSFLIIPKAIFNYFVHDIDPKTTIRECKNIFDFCGGVKIKGDWRFEEHSIKDGEFDKQKLQHTIRYYISNKGSKILKINNTDFREIQVEAGKWLQTVYVKHDPSIEFNDYNINYEYYEDKVEKEINNFEPRVKQLFLF